MYESFFGFGENPFRPTPDPKFLYLTRQHREALVQVTRGIEEGRGVVVLTGEAGTGKTTVIRTLLERLNANHQTAYVVNPRLSVRDFFKCIFHDLGLEAKTLSKDDYVKRFHGFLLQSHKEGKATTLIVDEAQNLEFPMFEEIGRLANLEAWSQKRLQVLLVGQPELNEILKTVDARHLRISLRCRLSSLNARETRQYIRTRLRIAGARDPLCFTDGCTRRIHRYAGGIPRIVNSICDNSLLLGYAKDKRVITPPLIDEVAENLSFRKRQVSRTAVRTQNSLVRDPLPRTPLFVVSVLAGLMLVVVPTNWSHLPSDRHADEKGIRSISEYGIREQADRFTVVVKKGDTITDILLRECGRSGPFFMDEVRRLNPDITDLDRIAAGQEIRLPIRPTHARKKKIVP